MARLNRRSVTAKQNQPGPDPAQLLVEYQAAQDSAQHHDTLVWSITGIVWGASLVLLGFMLHYAANPSLRLMVRLVVATLSVLGIVLNVKVWVFASQLADVKRQKYARCREIEQELGLNHHTALKYQSGSQRRLYSVVMVLFILAWVIVAVTALTANPAIEESSLEAIGTDVPEDTKSETEGPYRAARSINLVVPVVTASAFVLALLSFLGLRVTLLRPHIPVDFGFGLDTRIVMNLDIPLGDPAYRICLRFRNISTMTLTGVVLDMRFMPPIALSGTDRAVGYPALGAGQPLSYIAGQTLQGRKRGEFYIIHHFGLLMLGDDPVDFTAELNTENLSPGTYKVVATAYSMEREFKSRRKTLLLNAHRT